METLMPQDQLITGQTLSFTADPFHVPVDEAVQYQRHGAVLIRDGMIADVGDADTVFEAAIEAGAEDVESTDDGHEIYCEFTDLNELVDILRMVLIRNSLHKF